MRGIIAGLFAIPRSVNDLHFIRLQSESEKGILLHVRDLSLDCLNEHMSAMKIQNIMKKRLNRRLITDSGCIVYHTKYIYIRVLRICLKIKI